MTQRQIKLVENYIRLKVKKVLAEKKSLNEGSYSGTPQEVIEEIKTSVKNLYKSIKDAGTPVKAFDFNNVIKELDTLSRKLPKTEIWIND